MSTPIVRKCNDKVVGGVAGRLANRFQVDAGLVRAGFVIGLFIEPGTTVLIYLGLVFLLPRLAPGRHAARRVSSQSEVRTDFGATARDACVTGGRLALVLGAVAFAIGRAALAAGRAAAIAGSTAFRTRQPGRPRKPSAPSSPRPLRAARSKQVQPPRPAARTQPSARRGLRPARTATIASPADLRAARSSRTAPSPSPARVASPRTAPAPSPATPPRADTPAPPQSATPTAPSTPRTWMSDEERLEADVRAAVARTEAQAQRDLAATAAATKRARKMRRRRRVRRTLGTLTVAGGALWLANLTDLIPLDAIALSLQSPTTLAILVMAGGTWLVLSSLWRR